MTGAAGEPAEQRDGVKGSGQWRETGSAATDEGSRDAAGDAAGDAGAGAGAGRRQASDGVEGAGDGLAVASPVAGGGDAGDGRSAGCRGQQICAKEDAKKHQEVETRGRGDAGGRGCGVQVAVR